MWAVLSLYPDLAHFQRNPSTLRANFPNNLLSSPCWGFLVGCENHTDALRWHEGKLEVNSLSSSPRFDMHQSSIFRYFGRSRNLQTVVFVDGLLPPPTRGLHKVCVGALAHSAAAALQKSQSRKQVAASMLIIMRIRFRWQVDANLWYCFKKEFTYLFSHVGWCLILACVQDSYRCM